MKIEWMRTLDGGRWPRFIAETAEEREALRILRDAEERRFRCERPGEPFTFEEYLHPDDEEPPRSRRGRRRGPSRRA